MRKHKFIDKHPVVGSILMGLLLLFVSSIIMNLCAMIHTQVLGNISELFNILYTVIGALAGFAFYKLWFTPEFKGAFSGGNLKKGFIYCSPFIIYWIITAIAMLIDHKFELKGLPLTTIRVSITAGFIEEMTFRHGIASTMLRNQNRKEWILKASLISSIVFGLSHAFNIFAGANPLSTLLQVVTAGCLGVFFSAIYISCGNILPGIILHAVHDIYAISTTASVSESGVITGGLSFSDIIDLICCIALAIYAIKYYLSLNNQDEIIKIWDQKWIIKQEETKDLKSDIDKTTNHNLEVQDD